MKNIFLLCKWDSCSYSRYEILGWSSDKPTLKSEAERLENLQYQADLEEYLTQEGDLDYGPIPPGDPRREGYTTYWVQEVKHLVK